ncbi:MAG: hypothetical protein GOV01_01465 [Candidatus Altiarchaeota archaeon]|nr:hypothetical protein [Candidatus Altiarchaeota archaeon]
MDLIKAIIEKTKKSENEVWGLVEAKRKELDYLISEEGASHIIASELGVNTKSVFEVKGLEDGMKGIDITLVIIEVYDLRKFKRGNREGQVKNLLCKDSTGQVNVSLWDKKAELDLSSGDTVHIESGYVKKTAAGMDIRVGNSSGLEIEKGKQVKGKPVEKPNLKNSKDGDRIGVRASLIGVFRREPFFNSPEGKQLMFSGTIDDGTASMRAIFFRSAAESLVGISREKAIEASKMSGSEILLDKVPLLTELHFEGKVKKNDMTDSMEIIVNRVLKIDPEEEVDKEIERIIGLN